MLKQIKTETDILFQPLELPCGSVIKNRFFKSAMSEALGTVDNAPTRNLVNLYETFAKGGSGLVVTGNVMVDSGALGEPGNVAIENEAKLDLFKEWADAGTLENTHLWMQVNHPGKQTPSFLTDIPVAPSAIPLSGNLQKIFNPPRALLSEEIYALIKRFARSAEIAKKAGFTGIQIHAAHGYLISQFLSPRHNQRTDDWGGSPENRMRFVVEIYDAIRLKVGHDFPIGIKLNSADFQRGGFTNEESLDVIRTLASKGIDLIEISGGTYENPVMTGRKIKNSTRQREAYFLEFAQMVRKEINTPLVVTGGFRTANGMADAVVKKSVDMVGLARPLAIDPFLPKKIMAGENYISPIRPIKTGIRLIDNIAMLELTWYEQQLKRISKGKSPKVQKSLWTTIMQSLFDNGLHAFQRRRAKM